MDDKQKLVEDPPSYVTSQVPINTIQQGGTNAPVYHPQSGYTIQNVPGPAQNPGCCDCCIGRSDKFSIMSGRFTGLLQLIAAILIACLFAAAIVVSEEGFDAEYTGFCADIGGAVILFLPAGIIGLCTKNKGSCVIVAYLVMSILAAIQGVYVALVQGSAAAWFSFHTVCPEMPDVIDRVSSSYYEHEMPMDIGWGSCMYERNVCLVVIHSLSALVGFIEFIAAVVGAAFCCKGLTCCCSGQQTPASTVLVYAYGSGPIGAQTQASIPTESKA